MRWAILTTAALSVVLTIAAGLFVFVSYVERESTITCEAIEDLPYEADGHFVGSTSDLIVCHEQASYWWEND